MRRLALVAALATPASAVAADERAADLGDNGDAGSSLTGRLGVSLHLASGTRAIFPYDGEYCGSSGAYCLGRSPLRVDLGVSFRVSPSVDVLATGQLGIETDFGASSGDSGPRLLALAPGILGRLSETDVVDFVSTAQIVLDASSYDQVDGLDFGLRNENRVVLRLGEIGPDITASGYVFFAETLGLRRWLRLEAEAGAGAVAHF